MGVDFLGVSAAAMGEAKRSNATNCLKPLAIPDRWLELSTVAGAWVPGSTFDSQVLTSRRWYG
jgi:hypothetical protein